MEGQTRPDHSSSDTAMEFKYLSTQPIHPTFVQPVVTFAWNGRWRFDTRLHFKITVYLENGEAKVLEAKFGERAVIRGSDEVVASPPKVT